MNIRDVLYMRNTGKPRPRASIQDKLLAQKLSGGGIITTVTGNPILITDAKGGFAKALSITFSPKQSGSGDPSPDNVRPISGWTEASLTGAGKNLLNPVPVVRNATIGSNSINAYDGMGVYIVPMVKGATYAVKNRTATGYPVLGVTNETPVIGASAVKLVDMRNRSSYIYTNTDGYKYLLLSYGMNSFANYIDEIWIESGETPTAYEPYENPTDYTISLGGTYYGGVVDVVSGKLLNGWGYIASYDGETLPGRWLSDRDVYAPNTTPTTGAEVAYELATPIEIDLTPQAIALLEGSNTIWTDGASMELTYLAKK